MKFPEISPSQRLRALKWPAGEVPVVLDTDPYNEIDDQFAILYALLSESRLNVRAIHAAPFANVRSGDDAGRGMERSFETAEEMLRLLKADGLKSVPQVFRGAERFMTDPADPSGFTGSAAPSDAAANLIALADEHSVRNPLYVVAIAAITNVASAILEKPSIIKKMVLLWLAGHPHDHPDTDEFNLRQDVFASRVVLDSGVPLVMFPCANVAEHLRLSVADVRTQLKATGRTGAYLKKEFLKYAREKSADSRPIWDMAPVAWLTGVSAGDLPAVETAIIPGPMLTVSPVSTALAREPAFLKGRDPRGNPPPLCTWNSDPRRPLIREAIRIDRDAVFSDFFSKLMRFQASGKP